MGKRKRNAEDPERNHNTSTKRAKRQEPGEADDAIAENSFLEEGSIELGKAAGILRTEDALDDTQNLSKEERKRRKKERRKAEDRKSRGDVEGTSKDAEIQEIKQPESVTNAEGVMVVVQKKKRKKRKNRDSQESKEIGSIADGADQNRTREKEPKAHVEGALRKKDRRKNKPEKGASKISKKAKQQRMTPTWKTSGPVGGHMLDIDTIFSRDEQFLLVAYETTIAVYSTSTSLLVRQLRINESENVTAFALSSLNEKYLYVSTISGEITKWDWTEGIKLGHWRLSSSIYVLTTSIQNDENNGHEFVYTIDRKGGGPWLISAHSLMTEEDKTKTDVKTLLTYKNQLSSLKVLEDGRYIVATCGCQLIIGNLDVSGSPSLQDLTYIWRIVECPEWVVSIDVRVTQIERSNKISKGGRKTADVIDIAVGGLKGSIHLYENLLGKLIRKEQPNKKIIVEDIISRQLHWHRNAVLSVKWSLDGNYLISGGLETVMILWQLETGSKQPLPHLGAPIESIVVSPSGSSYSVRLADNSTMILSTSELTPTFSVGGIQTATSRGDSNGMPFVPTINVPSQELRNSQKTQSPAAISSSQPGCVLFAVPTSSAARGTSKNHNNAAYLQSFDIGSAHQVSKQALTRTRVTDLNMGPELNTLDEPNVIHIQVSFDGQWLATVDEWMPPGRDVAPLSFDSSRTEEERKFRQEIYLKIWSWNNDSKVWELVSRIDNPHAAQSGNPYDPGTVLELSSDPSAVGFATMGIDGIVKIWKPAIRRRNGLEVKNKDGKGLTSWHCKHVIPLEVSNLASNNQPQGAKLVYSHDGSVIAAAFQTPTPSPICLIDAYNGEIASLQTSLYSGMLLGLGIINSYLITLSNELIIWDLVNNELHYGIDLLSHGLSPATKLATSHLTVSFQQSLFAIALPEIVTTSNGAKLRSQIAIFDPADPVPLYQTYLPNTITTLLPAVGRKGFYALDSAAQIRTLTPISSIQPLLPSAPTPSLTAPPSNSLNNIFGPTTPTKNNNNKHTGLLTLMPAPGTAVQEPAEGNEAGTVAISQDQLAQIFDAGPAYAGGSVMNMFEQVAGLVNGRG